jgi:transcriptional regulator with XRE-family HTH domain
MSDPTFGEFLRRQREYHELSMRQFAEMVGISNPYLSQIEHGHREPSKRVLEAMARALELEAEKLYEQAGLHLSAAPDAENTDEEEPLVMRAIKDDPSLTGRQRQALLEIYRSITGRNAKGRR